MKFRGTMHWPLTGRHLPVLPLSHSTFIREGQLWLKSLISDFKYSFPSFHLPKRKFREVPLLCPRSCGSRTGGIQIFVAQLRKHGTGKCCQYIFSWQDNWKTRSRALFDAWLKRHRLPLTLHGKFEDFCDEQWAAHSQALEESGRLTWSQVQGVKSKLHHS